MSILAKRFMSSSSHTAVKWASSWIEEPNENAGFFWKIPICCWTWWESQQSQQLLLSPSPKGERTNTTSTSFNPLKIQWGRAIIVADNTPHSLILHQEMRVTDLYLWQLFFLLRWVRLDWQLIHMLWWWHHWCEPPIYTLQFAKQRVEELNPHSLLRSPAGEGLEFALGSNMVLKTG